MNKRPARAPSTRDPRVRVLLVDDSKDDYALACHLLAQTNANKSPRTRFELEWAVTYEAALEAMEQAQHHVYLVDYCLGKQDGLELLRTAIAGGCQAPIIILTGQEDQTVDVAAMQAGAADYLVKDRLTPELLERSLCYAIERKRTEQELQRYGDQLEELVRERTAELEEETLRQRNRELALLHQANQAFTSILDLDQVLVTVLEEVRHVPDAAACSVWPIDPQTGELACQQAAVPQMEQPLPLPFQHKVKSR